MKIAVVNKIEINAPKYFKVKDKYYKTLDDETQIVVYETNDFASIIITNSIKDTSFDVPIERISEEDFLTAFHKASDKIMNGVVSESEMLEQPIV